MEKVAAITPLADLGEAGAEKEEEEEGISVMGDEAVDTLNYNDKRRLLSKIVNPYSNIIISLRISFVFQHIKLNFYLIHSLTIRIFS